MDLVSRDSESSLNAGTERDVRLGLVGRLSSPTCWEKQKEPASKRENEAFAQRGTETRGPVNMDSESVL